MGQVCSGAKEESSKGGLLDVPSPSDTGDYADSSGAQHQASGVETTTTANDGTVSSSRVARDGDGTSHPTDDDNETEGQKAASAALADRERRKRRELWIVNGAARGMVAVRSTRGSTGYYDQGFAGLLAQHLEQTTSFPNKLPLVLPAQAPLRQNEASKGEDEAASKGSHSNGTEMTPAKKCTFYDRLAQPKWEGMELVVHPQDAFSTLRVREASAAASGDPHKLMDALAESLLDGPYTVLPAKQQLFAGIRPMVENLL